MHAHVADWDTECELWIQMKVLILRMTSWNCLPNNESSFVYIEAEKRCHLKVLWKGSRTTCLHFWIPDPVFKAQTWIGQSNVIVKAWPSNIFALVLVPIEGYGARHARSIDYKEKGRDDGSRSCYSRHQQGWWCPGAGLMLINFYTTIIRNVRT